MSGVQSIERAFAVLRALATGPAGVTELAERTGLPKSTVARLLSALEREGAVAQGGSGGRYQLGPAVADLAGAAAPGYNLIAAARPHLMELTKLTGETSGLSIRDQGHVYYLDHVESEESVMVRSWTGERLALHLVPSGLALLAGTDSGCVDRYLSHSLERSTDATVVDPAAIRARLDQIRTQGWIWFHQEFDENLCSVAAPVVLADGSTAAAVHVHGPAYRFPGRRSEEELGRLTRDAAHRLALQLS
jgi:DNA-binding IclR family transcriptional regulator